MSLSTTPFLQCQDVLYKLTVKTAIQNDSHSKRTGNLTVHQSLMSFPPALGLAVGSPPPPPSCSDTPRLVGSRLDRVRAVEKGLWSLLEGPEDPKPGLEVRRLGG